VGWDAHEVGDYGQELEVVDIGFEAGFADCFHQLLMFHVLLDEADDELFVVNHNVLHYFLIM